MQIKNSKIFVELKNGFGKFKSILRIENTHEREFAREIKRDKKANMYCNPIIDIAIVDFKKQKGSFGSFSLAESSVRCLVYNLLLENRPILNICEFGGGQSTRFWSVLSSHLSLSVNTYEHDPEWAEYLNSQIQNKRIKIHSCELMQIDELSRKMLFSEPYASINHWKKSAKQVTASQIKDPILKNAFYNIKKDQFPDKQIDAIVLDGPHGNGRSICFPLFYNFIDKGTIILIDDYFHYPFLDDLGLLFNYEVIEEKIFNLSKKGYVVLRILDKVAVIKK